MDEMEAIIGDLHANDWVGSSPSGPT